MEEKIVLAIDTTSKISSVCIKENEKIYIKEDESGATHSKTLIPSLISLIEEKNIDKDKIKDIIVCVGPGSFTGIRIGIASVKGLAFNRNIKVLEITSLELLARNVTRKLRQEYIQKIEKLKEIKIYIISSIDAKNNQVYYGIYEFKNDILTKIEEVSSNKQVLLEKIAKYSENKNNKDNKNNKIYIVGDGIDNKDIEEYNQEKYENSRNINISNIEVFVENKQTTLSAIDKYVELEKNNKLIENLKKENEILPNYLKKSQAQRLKMTKG